MGNMKVHQLGRGLIWEHGPSLSLAGCKRLRPLAPKLHQHQYQSSSTSTTTTTDHDHQNQTVSSTVSSFDLKSFIRPESGPRKFASSHHKRDSPQAETQHPGGTRWNPTQEQIGILEMLYRGGMRTPNAQKIEQITAQLGKYGKIEGKNVFYWFQNHKARERQKQKRNTVALITHSPTRNSSASNSITTISLDTRGGNEIMQKEEDSPYKRKCRSWSLEYLEDQESRSPCCNKEENRTLELFPLHPEGR